MNRNDDTSARSSQMPAYDDQGNPLNQEDMDQEERDLLGLSQQEDDEPL